MVILAVLVCVSCIVSVCGVLLGVGVLFMFGCVVFRGSLRCFSSL